LVSGALPIQAQRGSAPANLPAANPYTSPADLELGRKLFLGRCGHCHGQSGEGGRGAAINTGRFRRGSSDRDLFLIIRNGIPNTEMPGSRLPEHEIWRMVTWVKQLGSQGVADETPSGDPMAGAAVYQRAGCAACHSIGGQGGHVGPELDRIGSMRAVRYLRESMLQPAADIPIEYRTVIVTPLAGREVTGIHLNEDEYSVHLRDMSGNLRSFLKSEVKAVKLPRTSTMPDYSGLEKADLENLVAYLSSLRN
jgi:putative heme-binding domain-containing protein